MPWYIVAMLFAGPTIMAFCVGYAFKRWRPIGINESGISALAFSKPWKFIPWSEIRKIEKIRMYDATSWRYSLFYHVYGQNRHIGFENGLKQMDSLLEAINSQIAKFHIDVEYIDLGTDTLAKVTDRAERKKLWREGVRVAQSKL